MSSTPVVFRSLTSVSSVSSWYALVAESRRDFLAWAASRHSSWEFSHTQSEDFDSVQLRNLCHVSGGEPSVFQGGTVGTAERVEGEAGGLQPTRSGKSCT